MQHRNQPPRRFPLGHIVITPNALDRLDPGDACARLRRHALGDWGELPPEDIRENELSKNTYEVTRLALRGGSSPLAARAELTPPGSGSQFVVTSLPSTISLKEDFHLFSAYTDRHTTRLYIIAEADRSVTTLLLPEDYWVLDRIDAWKEPTQPRG